MSTLAFLHMLYSCFHALQCILFAMILSSLAIAMYGSTASANVHCVIPLPLSKR